MRIALLVSEYVTEINFDGGLANYTHRIALALAGAGHEPVVFIQADRDQTIIHDGIEIHRVKNRRSIWISIVNKLTLHRLILLCSLLRQSRNLNRALRQTHRHAPFDIVQYTHLGGIGCFRTRSIPAVARLSSYTPLCYHFGEYSDRSRFQIWQQVLAENLAMRRVDSVFGPCRLIAEAVHKKLAIAVHVIESPFVPFAGPEDETLYRQELAGKEYLLYFGRISPPKGALVIAAMLRELLRRHSQLYFVLAGRETTGYAGRTMMEHLYEQAGEFRSRVLHLGRVGHSQLFPVIRRAAAVVLPSLIENFPNVCLESLSVGQITVATRDSGFDQLIVDGMSGWLSTPNDPESLLAATEKALAMDEDARRQMGRAAQERIAQLNPGRVAAAHLAFYRETIGQTAARRRPARGGD